MSLEATLARIELLTGRTAAPPVARTPATAAVTPAAAPGSATSGGPFAAQLQSALGSQAAQPLYGSAAAAPVTTGAPPGSGPGARALAAAQAELAAGVAEQPPGSNDGPRIAEYRKAVPGGPVGPWCAYFTSWAARQAGAPVGEQGQGFAGVAATMAWAQRTGRDRPAGSRPSPGDLIVWGGRHIGIVESVAPDGRITTIEGNSSDKVSRRTYGPDGGGATGYVRLG